MKRRFLKQSSVKQSNVKQSNVKQDIKYVITDEYRQKILSEYAYIGQQGFTILKAGLDTEDLNELKLLLTVNPIQSFSGPMAKTEVSFPVYRENPNKIYIPRFFGEQRYGIPFKNELSKGDDITVPFVKPIRDYQEKIIQVYFDHVLSVSSGGAQGTGGGILEVPCGRGKTVMALKIISVLNKKTLILVHKEFLMNQWIERIAEFMPTARIGKIQGPTFDIEQKDIVIGMIQSLYDRPFSTNAFASFGLTIIDEVHRIGSEEFSKTLFKTITNYMLGISATVDRKDGLTNVLHMFIGPKIYSEERKDEDIVEVRAIEYANTNEEYNEVVYDYMGNVQHTTMISKISKFQPRCDFLVRVLKDLMRENSDKQIMVLSQIRGLLTLIHEQLHEHYDVGFYVGGMKKEDLQATEEKQIVLATYAMAAEALDIKTLNTLVMVSPKTDIIQSVGRILRTRAEGKLIVDIVDTHTVFQNQWKKRRVYYKKCGYGIQYIKSPEYVDMQTSIWKRIANPLLQSNNSKPICITEGEEGKDDEDIEKHTCLIDVSQYNFDQTLF
jgi:superfamily II DNA or RNA helicase